MCPTPSPPPPTYEKGRTYTVKEFEDLNRWLKTNELVVEGQALNSFDLDSTGKLIPVPQTPILKEVVVAKIVSQLTTWNVYTQQNGAVTSSQGGFNLDTSGGRTIRAPDVAFTPPNTYQNLTQQQLTTFQGLPFCPTVIVEVEDVSLPSKLNELDAKIKSEYFPAGIELALLVDPIIRKIITFKRDVNGVVKKWNCGWRDVACNTFLPDFVLQVAGIDSSVGNSPASPSSGPD